MIRNLKLKNHKALRSVSLENLGHINIVCGRNNSGKTTILEAMCDKAKVSVGKLVDSPEWLEALFEPEANKYTNPSSQISKSWFRSYIEEQCREDVVWFSGDIDGIIGDIKKSQKSHNVLGRHQENLFNYNSILNAFFSKVVEYFEPILIPPKRRLDFKSNIVTNEEITPSGSGLVNKLFYLKNQDLESGSYKIYKNIYDTFLYITNSKFNVVPNTENKIELFYKTDDVWISAEACGLGLTDVLILVTVLNVFENKVILIEEPENHLHADFQKRLLAYLTTIKFKQFIISTHSSVFLNTDVIDRIFFSQCSDEVRVSDQTTKSEIINSLGYSLTENLVADLIILLEGPTDIPVIKEMIKWVGVDMRHNIKYWPLGGDIMSVLDLSVFAERNNVFALIDSDPGSSVQRTRFIRNCKANQIYCRKLTRYSIENYFTLSAIRDVFQKQIPAKIKSLDHSLSVDDQIGFRGKNKTIKAKNHEVVKKMEYVDIVGTDLERFLLDIKEHLENN